MSEKIERKYRMTRLAAGDYLLPANDGQTLWRIAKYLDGPSQGLVDWPRDREIWGAWRLQGSVEDLQRAIDRGDENAEDLGGDLWGMEVCLQDTREAAIQEALRVT